MPVPVVSIEPLPKTEETRLKAEIADGHAGRLRCMAEN
ncbi:hypothetical protein ACVWWD_006133 [Mesorhizobium sp. URHB0026]